MVATLVPHPQSKPKAVKSIEVGLGRELPSSLVVMFKLEGDLERLVLDPARPDERADNLWQSTCFECFVGDVESPSYREFNLSPLGGWAVYDFASYRAGMTDVSEMTLAITQEHGDGWMTLQSHLPQAMPKEPCRLVDWRVGLSAVIEEKDGTMSYWALVHPPGKPDFHHPDCFALELPPPIGA